MRMIVIDWMTFCNGDGYILFAILNKVEMVWYRKAIQNWGRRSIPLTLLIIIEAAVMLKRESRGSLQKALYFWIHYYLLSILTPLFRMNEIPSLWRCNDPFKSQSNSLDSLKFFKFYMLWFHGLETIYLKKGEFWGNGVLGSLGMIVFTTGCLPSILNCWHLLVLTIVSQK